VISPDLTTNDPEKQKQSESGGLTLDATGAENHCTLLVIEPSSVEKDMLWVASDDGRVHFTQDAGSTWNEVTKNIKGFPKGSWITQIKASNKNKGEALLVANDYRRFNYTPYAYRTKNYGKTWERIVDGGDVENYTLSIVEDPINPNLMFLGTDDGLYISLNAGKQWDKFDAEIFPTVSVKDLVIHPREHDLVIGTFGRAAWVLDDIRPLRALASSSSIIEKDVQLFEPPTAYLAAYQQPTGSRFGADAMYQGTNRKYGAMLSYFVNPPVKKDKDSDKEEKANDEDEAEKKEAKKDSLTLMVYDGERLIRTLKKKIPKEKGIYRWYWYMDEKGVSRPRRKPSKSKREPSGVQVKPGTYRLVMSFGDEQSEQTIEVKSDPRLTVDPANIDAVYTASKELEGYTAAAAAAVKQLAESKQTLTDYKKLFKENKSDEMKTLLKEMKSQTKTIDSLIALYIGKEDKRQGIVRNPESNVLTRIRNASRYTRSRQEGITVTENKLLQHAKEELEVAIEQTNNYYKEVWPVLKSKIEAEDTSRFKEIQELSID